MTADDNVGVKTRQHCFDFLIPGTWIACYVGHVNLHAFAFPFENFGDRGADFRSVYVAPDTTEGFECLDFVHDRDRTKVSGMPDFVAISEVGKYGGVQKAVRV